MRISCQTAVLGLFALVGPPVALQKPVLSQSPLDPVRLDVYRAFLRQYANDRTHPPSLADKTYPLKLTVASACTDGLLPESVDEAGSLLHPIPLSLAQAAHLQLVDGAAQVHRALHPTSANEAISPLAVRLLSLSEIAFNKNQDRAVMSFAYWCGTLCGNGAVLVFERNGEGWKRSSQECGVWVS